MRARVYFTISAVCKSDKEVIEEMVKQFNTLKDLSTASLLLSSVIVEDAEIKPAQEAILDGLDLSYLIWRGSCDLYELEPFIDRWNAIEKEKYKHTFSRFTLRTGNSGLLI